MSNPEPGTTLFDSEFPALRLVGRIARMTKALLLSLCALALFAGVARAQSALDEFDPIVNGSVNAVVILPNGKIMIGGNFSAVNGVTRENLARLNPDGSLDTSFTVGTDAAVTVLLVQTDGKVAVGGLFAQLGGQTRNRIGRLNADGALDASFNPNANGFVNAIAQQADGRVILGGSFTTIGGQPASRIARLGPSFGSLDTGFDASVADGSVTALAIQPNGMILLGGSFSSVNGLTRNRMARVNYAGALDAFTPNVSGSVRAIALQPGGKIVIGGDFATVSGQGRNRIARLNVNGSVDTAFNPNASASVQTLAVQSDGKILVGGDFTMVGGQARNRLARLEFDGDLDGPFSALINDVVYSVAVQPDGKIVAGGGFTSVDLQTRNRIVRLYADSTLESRFVSGTDGTVYTMAQQPDGKILVGGEFTTLAGQPRNNIGRLNPDGSLDTSFNPGANGIVNALAVQPDGKVLVGGNFAIIAGTLRPGVARLNANGSFDAGFTAGTNNPVRAIIVQPDGKIVIGGAFTVLSGQPRNYLARLNTDGSLDGNFTVTANDNVFALALETDGQIVVGGTFTQLGGQTRNRIGRVNANGTLDSGFNPGVSSSVTALAIQRDGKILVGGAFSTLGGASRQNLGRLLNTGAIDTGFNPGTNSQVTCFALQADGKIIIGGIFTEFSIHNRNRIARVAENGLTDDNFNPGANGGVNALLVQADGKVVVGGSFTTLASSSREHLGRLTNTEAALQNLTVNAAGTVITWLRDDASPELARVTFELSTDGVSFSPLAEAARISGGWQLSGLSLTPNVNFFVRARGFYAGGYTSSSGSLTEAVNAAFVIPCSLSVDPIAQNAVAAGGNFALTITAASQSCNWLAQSNATWLTLGSTSGTGTGIIGYSVAANPGPQRIGTMTVAGQTITVTQASAVCPTITVSPANATLPAGEAGQAYNQTFTAGGGAGPYSYSIVAGALPNGLTLSTSGVLSGAPTVFGFFNFTVRATDINGCFGSRAYSLTVTPPCAAIIVNPMTLPTGTVGTAYNQTVTATGGTAPYTFSISAGSLPSGVSLASGGAITGTPNAFGIYNFTIKATDANGCLGTRAYSVVINPNGGGGGNAGLQFYPLPKPLRLLDTRAGFTGCDAPAAAISGNTSRTQLARRSCDGITIPANAMAVTGNITTVQSGGGYLTLYPSDAAQPLVANSNYAANEIINNVFTVGLGNGDGSFKIFVTSNTDVVVDITGYYAPPAGGGLYFHPLPKPIRLLETRAGFNGAFTPGVKLAANADTPQQARVSYDGVTIPATALAIVGNATTINGGAGYMTLYPGGVPRPLAASSNFSDGQVMNAPFTVGLSAAGEFNIFTTTNIDVIVDVLGYYSADANDANGTGLLFNSLPAPVRLLETRAGFTGCYTPGAPLLTGSTRQQQARGACGGQTIAANALAIVGNATVINNQAGYLTFWPNGAAQPLVASSNFAAGQILNRHFTVGLGATGMFNIFASGQTDLIVDVSGFFAP